MLVSPSQSSAGEEITASKINTPVNQLASGINAINDAQIVDVSGTKITAGTIPASAMNTATNVETRFDEALGDFVASGCIWSLVSGLNGSMTAGVVYVDGKRAIVTAIASRAFTASKDTYVSVSNAGAVSYSEVVNGATAPSLPANSIFIAKIVTSAVAITSVVQSGSAGTSSNQLYPKSFAVNGLSTGGTNANAGGGTTNYFQLGQLVICWGETAASSSIASGSAVNMAVTFPVVYGAAPVVTASAGTNSGETDLIVYTSGAATTTSVGLALANPTTGGGAGTGKISWVAIGVL